MKATKKTKIAVLASSNYITVLVSTILFPIFPAMAAALDVTLRDLAWFVGLVSFPATILNLVGGILADRLGRKLIIVVSLFLYGIGGLAIGLAALLLESPWTVMLIGRFVQGVGAATPMFLTIALVGDLSSGLDRSRSLGVLETANGLGKVSSPVLGGAIGLISWYAVFFLYPVVAFPVAIATWLAIEEPPKRQQVAWEDHKKAFRLFTNVSRLLGLLAAFTYIFLLIGTMFWMGDFLEAKLQMHQLLRGLVIAIPAVAMVVTTLFAGAVAKKSNPRWVVGGSLLLMAGSIFLLAFTAETLFFWPVIVMLGIGAGLGLPSIDNISTNEEPAIRGAVTTMFGSLRSLGGALAPIAVSHLMDIDLHLMFFAVAGVGVITSLLVLIVLDPEDVLPKGTAP